MSLLMLVMLVHQNEAGDFAIWVSGSCNYHCSLAIVNRSSDLPKRLAGNCRGKRTGKGSIVSIKEGGEQWSGKIPRGASGPQFDS